ncbi:2,3-dihydroxybenzoate-AMP ligase/pyochelin biosynthesis protein PchD [Kitasatospora sp. SolWspMP-SS2h]|uniref:AMP-binding protein n=1 Tax=Kitasatospora sp. SolWspMP-SS2h TaxID=1305729 RepID=UPI000DB9C681|nr:AMP-binding protein [Kitasatospora sp. SolWspMP-SS2h]RAJ43067.1 2,3-dihydroxybenzoate-AMP ligase/pyochelin biosynthesis protein PchD [Kitasatospora sp. SolWspMP-SS2h]
MDNGLVDWPADVASKYVKAGAWRDENLYEWLVRGADCYPESLICDGERQLTRPEFVAVVDRMANALHRAGVRAGEHVVLQMSNQISGLACLFACARTGVVPLLAIPQLGTHELLSFIDRTGATTLVATPDCLETCRTAGAARPAVHRVLDTSALLGGPDTEPEPGFPRTAPDSVAALLVSGGTTGLPKIVPEVHRAWLYLGRCVADRCRFDPRSVYLIAMPLAHGWAMCNLLAVLDAGGSLVISPTPAPTVAFALIARYGVTRTGLNPSLAALWADAAVGTPHDISSLRTALIGGSTPAAEVLIGFGKALNCGVHQGFGMTEGLCGIQPPDLPQDRMLADQGVPLSALDELLVIDEAGDPVGPGEVGQLLTRGPYTIRGYYGEDPNNSTVFTADGWYMTGDLVRLDADGAVSFEGRIKNQINRGGEKVSEREVEELLRRHPGIRDVAVVGAPDDRFGEAVVAFVVGEDLSQSDLGRFLVAAGAARYKIPTTVHPLAEIPLTPVGRVNKLELRRLAASPNLIGDDRE